MDFSSLEGNEMKIWGRIGSTLDGDALRSLLQNDKFLRSNVKMSA